jgi:signal peptidase
MLYHPQQQHQPPNSSFTSPPDHQLPYYAEQQPTTPNQERSNNPQHPPQVESDSASSGNLQRVEQPIPNSPNLQNEAVVPNSQSDQHNPTAQNNNPTQSYPEPQPNSYPMPNEQKQGNVKREKKTSDSSNSKLATNERQRNSNNTRKNKSSQKQEVKNDSALKTKSLKSKIFDWAFYSFLLALLVVAIIWAQGDRPPIWINDHTVKNVLTGSMYPDIPQGALIVINRLDPNELQVGDDITFFVTDTITFTHRIRAILEDYYEGARGFRTYGINNDWDDEDTVLARRVAGRVVYSIAWLGNLTNIMNQLVSQPIYLVFIGVFILIFVMLSYAIRGLLSNPDKKNEDEKSNDKQKRNNGRKKKKLAPKPVSTANT